MKKTVGLKERLAGIAIMGALVVLLDYSLNYSGLKIPFPWMPSLRFDFDGVPIALCRLLYGLPASAVTSIVACIAIAGRSGDIYGAAMKMMAEFATVSGVGLARYMPPRYRTMASFPIGVALRIAIASVSSLVVIGAQRATPYVVVINTLPTTSIFNAIQGTLTLLLGYLIFEAYVRRALTVGQG